MAFLGIRIPHETGRLLSGLDVPGNKEGASEYHITLLCFEENWPISEISKALEATYKIVSEIKPFSITVTEVTCFPKREDKPVAIIAKIESEELHNIRKKLAKEFDKQGIDFSKIHKDFKPHITLSYADEEIDSFDIDPVECIIHEIVLWGGDMGDNRIFITFPLKGPEKQKNSLLLQKADLFYKMAKNPNQKYLRQSAERRKTDR